MTSKTCTKCKETKQAAGFYKQKDGKYGLASRCKDCHNDTVRRYREANKEKIAERDRRYKEANKEKVAEYQRRYKEANKERLAEEARRHYEANKEQYHRKSKRRDRETNARSLELAHRQGIPWEDWECEFITADNGLTTYQKAVKLGRSYNSVQSKQVKLRKSARAELVHND